MKKCSECGQVYDDVVEICNCGQPLTLFVTPEKLDEEYPEESPSYYDYEVSKKDVDEESKTKKVFKIIGVVILVLLVVASWFSGFFGFVFYILGLYAALYFLSLLFRTTAILDIIMTIGGFILYVGFAVLGLFLLYVVLRVMFEESFFLGLLLLFFGIPLAEMILFALLAALSLPLIYFREQLEERFKGR